MERRIQPWARGLVCASWVLMCAQTFDQKTGDEIEAAVCTLVGQCTGMQACPGPEYIERENCTYDAAAAADCADGLAELTCQDWLDSWPSACDEVYTDCSPCENDPSFEDMDEVSVGVFGDDEVLCSNVDTNVYDGPITAGNPDWGPWFGGDDHTEFYAVYAFERTLDEGDIDRIDRHYTCGVGVNAVMGCDAFGNELTPGGYVVAGSVLKGPVPLQDATYTCQYGFVFDRDSDPSNNYEAQPSFGGDFFQGTDLWIVLQYTPFVGWFLDVVELRNGIPQPIDGLARVIIDGNSMTALVPKSFLPAAAPGYRATVHCHQGDFGETLPTTADTEERVEEPLRVVTQDASGTGGNGTGGGAPDGGVDGGTGGGGTGGGGGEPDEDDGGGCGCRVSPETVESNAALALLVLLALGVQQRRRRKRSSR